MAEKPDVRTVELVAGVDITKLPLGPQEGFVFSRIQGRTRVSEIANLVGGMPAEQLEETLRKLSELGAVRLLDAAGQPLSARAPQPTIITPLPRPPPVPGYDDPARRRSSARHRSVLGGSRRPSRPLMAESGISTAPQTRSVPPVAVEDLGRSLRATTPAGSSEPMGLTEPVVTGAGASTPAATTTTPTSGATTTRPTTPTPAATTPAASGYDAKELEEVSALPLARRRQVLELLARIKSSDHYEVLGVTAEATRKEIRTAYFRLSKAFHPDTMFRRDLGSFKHKMEVVFNRITEAYDILSKKGPRADYDEYLRATAATRETEEGLRMAVELGAAVEGQGGAGEKAADAPVSSPAAATPRSERGKDMARQVMARRLSGVGRDMISASRSGQPPAVSQAPASPQAPMERRERLRTLTASLRQARDASGAVDGVAALLAAARQAEARGDLAAAQEHLQQAMRDDPSRGDLQQDYARLAKLLAGRLADDYAAQAELEEKQGSWAAAALSWSKVFAGRERDANAARRTAAAMLKAGGDLRGAHNIAQQAVFLEPDDHLHRITLAQVMLNIGLHKGARRELETAHRLDPSNEIVKNLLAELKD